MFCMDKRRVYSLGFAAVLLAVGTSASWADTPAEKKFNIHKCLLQIYLTQRKSEAGTEYSALLALKPNDAQMHFEYGNFLLRGGNNGGAATQYRAACKYQGRMADYQIGLGNALMRLKDYPGAIVAYSKACQIGGATGSQSPQTLLQGAQQYQQQQANFNAYQKQLKDNE
jgi:predicted Zn-dependent protease